ncbi:MAG: molybdopterin-dependent oxidoreductase [Chloroflexi bacterium]|nr:molybdopterin-dependent oxidoreductase [Chloroflexota bacterium]
MEKASSVEAPSLLLGALLGGITILPVMALMFLASRLAGLPFVPFDLFDWISRAIPGNVLTVLIDSMVKVILLLKLGNISHTAKILEQAIAIITVLVLGIVFGAVLAYALMRVPWSSDRIGLTGGSILALFVIGVELSRGFQASLWLGVPWLALLMVGWGTLLARWLGREVRPAESPLDRAAFQADRRALLLRIAGGSTGIALAASGLGWLIKEQHAASGANLPLPRGGPEVPSIAPRPQAGQPVGQRIEPAAGTRPEVTANEDFYRIDINLLPPSLRQDSWQLSVKGLFDRPRSLSLSDLMAFPAVTQPITLSCISNPIGGDLIGNAYWTGLRLVDLLEDLGLRAAARELRIDAADGFAESVTMPDLTDARTLLVYGMNGKTLTIAHGFPLRILIPNHYGMKQPKWITGIEAIDRGFVGYWVERGWSQEARPQVLTIIDNIARDVAVDGLIPIGGVAWAGDRGIKKVEVQVDGGPWEEARLRFPPLGGQTWVQWRYDWKSVAGRHTFRVRGADGAGREQTGKPAEPFPDGATGYHSITVTI